MTKVKFIAALLAVALGGLMLSGAALATRPDAPGATSQGAKGKAAFCNRLDELIEMKQNAGNRLEKVAARIQARIASGDLTAKQTARAQAHLTRVTALIVKLDKRVDRLNAAVTKHCTPTT